MRVGYEGRSKKLFVYPVTVFLTSFQTLATMSHKINLKTVILGTGGTIAGVSLQPGNPAIYRSGQLGIADLIHPTDIHQAHIEFQDIARIDSKNIDLPVWQQLYKALKSTLSREDVRAAVITHGTDTIEETAFLLDSLGPWLKPVIMTCAMKPADHPEADGPVNLRDALLFASQPSVHGVYVVFGSQAHHALNVQKVSIDEQHAFSSGLAGAAATQTGAQWHMSKSEAPVNAVLAPTADYFLKQTQWPRVEWLTHHAASSSECIDALIRQPTMSVEPLRGLVIAGTGAGTVKPAWEKALQRAMASGIEVWLTSRCTWGKALPQAQQDCGHLSHLPPAKACIALALALMQKDEENSAL